MDRYDFERAVADAARAMAAGSSERSIIDLAARACVETIENCDLAGICVFDRSGAHTLAVSRGGVELIDELQVDLGEGPALSELRTLTMFTAGDLLDRDDAPWPRWGPQVTEEIGVRSFMGFRLFVREDAVGVLNVYSFKPHAFTHLDLLDGTVLASHAAIALDAQVQRDHVASEMRAQHTIGVATGILRERFALTEGQAFSVLEQVSSRHDIKLFEVAQQLVETGTLPAENA